MTQAQALAVMKEGIAAAKKGEKAQARQLFRQAAELDPRQEVPWLWLAGLAESPLESVSFLERALELNPTHEKARKAIRVARVQAGIAAAKSQDKAHARLLLRKAVELEPTNEIAWLWLASVAETIAQAVQHLEKVLELNPGNERARTSLERYRKQRAAREVALAPMTTFAQLPPGLRSPGAGPVTTTFKGGEHTQMPAHPGEALSLASEEVDRSIDVSFDRLWECPFCQATTRVEVERCLGCGAILTLDHIDSFFRPIPVDHEKLNSAIERLEQTGSNPTSAWQLGMAYLNLKQFEVALDFLHAASEAEGLDSAILARLEALEHHHNALRQPRSAGKGQRKTILVVDDSPTIRKLVTMTVERRGFATRTAADGSEAIDVIRDHGVPDLILLDITMPGMDGYQLCKLLRGNADTTNLPIIMLSGKDGFFSKVRGRMAGSTAYITKPFEPEGLLQVVERYCVPEETVSLGPR